MFSYCVLRSAVGKTHVLRSNLWWTIPLHILHWSFWDTIGIPTDQVALARHSGVQVPVISRHFWTFQFLPTGLHGLCFGFCFAGPLPLRSLIHGPLIRVLFGKSLVIDYTQKSTISTLALKLSVSAIIYPRWTATLCASQEIFVYKWIGLVYYTDCYVDCYIDCNFHWLSN